MSEVTDPTSPLPRGLDQDSRVHLQPIIVSDDILTCFQLQFKAKGTACRIASGSAWRGALTLYQRLQSPSGGKRRPQPPMIRRFICSIGSVYGQDWYPLSRAGSPRVGSAIFSTHGSQLTMGQACGLARSRPNGPGLEYMLGLKPGSLIRHRSTIVNMKIFNLFLILPIKCSPVGKSVKQADLVWNWFWLLSNRHVIAFIGLRNGYGLSSINRSIELGPPKVFSRWTGLEPFGKRLETATNRPGLHKTLQINYQNSLVQFKIF